MNHIIMKTRVSLVQGCKLSQTSQKLHNTYNVLVEGMSISPCFADSIRANMEPCCRHVSAPAVIGPEGRLPWRSPK